MHIIVSVVIPIYNVDLYLRQCLDSLGVLGRKDIEIILVNDGSTDSCRDLCIEYKEKWSNIVPLFLIFNAYVSTAICAAVIDKNNLNVLSTKYSKAV